MPDLGDDILTNIFHVELHDDALRAKNVFESH